MHLRKSRQTGHDGSQKCGESADEDRERTAFAKKDKSGINPTSSMSQEFD